MTSGAMARRRPASSAESSVRLPHAVKACTSQRDVASTQAVGTASRMGQLVTLTLRRARRRRDEGLGARSILAVVTEGSLTCPPWRSHLEVDLQSETRPRLAVAQMMHSVRGFIFDEQGLRAHGCRLERHLSSRASSAVYSCDPVYLCVYLSRYEMYNKLSGVFRAPDASARAQSRNYYFKVQ